MSLPGISDEQKAEAVKAAQGALDSAQEAKDLMEKAAATQDPDRRAKLLKEAFHKQLEARSQGKAAAWLQSGSIQGALGGFGIGGAVGTGLGTLTGTLVGATATLAVGGLGALVGLGVGALTGPFMQIGPPKKAAKDEREDETVKHVAAEIGRQATPPPEELERMAGIEPRSPPRRSRNPDRKPKKLQVRQKA
ncbi:hypothetical protein LTR78_004654 [Recurvomyces mirabilis]|uniref:Uncharacterized protein n=1 Tax=Recurvomyces mirabilis TaxID=574656 RepID=A0AAE0WPG9_9PEZI|nr:hypothetical protein LTR78_004654 [Recurvomyces mirabilis]KAK5152853.1 hypothetical protein LTS14_007960 [Recurvomyces mirabilis]